MILRIFLRFLFLSQSLLDIQSTTHAFTTSGTAATASTRTTGSRNRQFVVTSRIPLFSSLDEEDKGPTQEPRSWRMDPRLSNWWVMGGCMAAVLLLVETMTLLSLPEVSNAMEPGSLNSGLLLASTSAATSAAITTTSMLSQGTNAMDFQTTIVTAAAAVATTDAAAIDWSSILQKASSKALGGGKAGASAAVVQVLSLMWLRTSMNRQYRYGGDLSSSLKALWDEGGIPRLYQGLPFALIQGPLTRFGDTAANVGVLTLLETIPETQALPLPAKTAVGSVVAGIWRILLMPIDASKTAMQVEGSAGLGTLYKIAREEGPGILYQGAVAQAAATAVGHFPWYLTYNFLNDHLPTTVAMSTESKETILLLSLARSAFLGLCSSCVSDVCSNSLRVIKTTKQTARLGNNDSSDGTTTATATATATTTITDTNAQDLSYTEIVKNIIAQDGLQGLFGRGLQTRLLTNAIQGAVFSVLWRYFQQAGAS